MTSIHSVPPIRPDYPKARQQARRVKNILSDVLKFQGGPTEVAIVSSTENQITTGYVQGTTRKGPIQIVGVPLNSVVPGMKIFVHQLTQRGLNYYVFDGAAPVPAAILGSTSASIANATGVGPAAANSAVYGSNAVAPGSLLTTVPSTSTGWFWSFFFYTPSLPAPNAPCVLLDMPQVNGGWSITGGFRITYDYQGHFNAYFYNSGPVGTGTTYSFAPHHVWFVTMQLGTGCFMNGLDVGTGISNLSTGSLPAGNYGMFLLSDSNGLNPCPAGSWISKIVFGNNSFAGNPLIPYNQNFIPSSDSQIITGSSPLGSGLRVYNRWLCSDGGATLPDTGLGGETLQVFGQFLSVGPY